MHARTPSPWLVAPLLAAGCYAFPDPRLGECGNRIVESDEDCDDPDDLSCEGCRIVCAPLADDPGCPAGKVCGNDEHCRAPSGAFEAAIGVDHGAVQWIEAGDLDGDRQADLVTQLADPDIEVIHFDMKGPTTLHLGNGFGIAAVGGLGGDGRDDVLVAYVATADVDGGASGLGLLGEVGELGERAPVAATFATLTTDGDSGRLLAVTPVRDRVLELVTPTVTRRWVEGSPAALPLDPPIAIDASTLGWSLAFADLDGVGTCAGGVDTADYPRAEVALANNNASAVHIVSTCGGTDPSDVDYLPDVALSSGVLGKAGSFLVDVNDDDRLDLVAQSSKGVVLVAYGVGDGSFHSDAAVPPTAGDGAFSPTPLWEAKDAMDQLFAVADFDDDGTVELVTAQHWVAAPEACTDDCPRAWPGPLAVAVAVDINDDGMLDVVGTRDEDAVLHLAAVGPEQPFKSHDIELIGPAHELVIGDFDRDTIEDVAFVETDPAAPKSSQQQVTVLYGSPLQPSRLERFGPFARVETLVVEHGETIVARTKDELARPAGAFIRPGASAYDFGLAIRGPVLVRAGTDVVAASIVLPPDATTERLAHFGFRAGTLSPHDIVVGPELVGLAAGTGPTALLAAIDLVDDPAGIDELVILGTTPQGGTVWVAQLDPTSGAWSVVDTFVVPQGSFRRRPLVTDPDGVEPTPGPGSTLAVGDYDGDGDPDVLATIDSLMPSVVALRNDGGALAHAPVALFSEQTSFEYAHIEPWHVRVHPTDPNAPGKQLWLVAGEDGVGVIEIDPENDHIEFDEVDSTRATALASADVDGDGLLDLVVGATRGLRIHLAEAHYGAP